MLVLLTLWLLKAAAAISPRLPHVALVLGTEVKGIYAWGREAEKGFLHVSFFFFYEDFFYFLFFLKKGELFWASWRKLSTSCQQQETSITRRELLLHSFHVCNSSSLVLGHAATRDEAWAFKEAVFFSQFPLRKDTKCSWCFAEIFPRLKPLTMISGSLLEAGYSLSV